LNLELQYISDMKSDNFLPPKPIRAFRVFRGFKKFYIGDKMNTQTANVVVFSTPTCSWCRKTKDYLRKHNIRFKDIDVARDQAAARDMVRRTGQQGVPVIMINNRPIVGFDKNKIDNLLGIKDRS